MRPPDEGQIRAMGKALDTVDNACGHPCWSHIDEHLAKSDSYYSLARAILQSLPYGWELVVYTYPGGEDERID